MKYLVIILIFFSEFALGQVPGTPRLFGKSTLPVVYTIDFTVAADLSSAQITAQAIPPSNQNPITQSGILWSTGIPTISNYLGRTTNGTIDGSQFIHTAGPLPADISIYIVAYATNSFGTTYGKLLTVPNPTVLSPYTNKTWMSFNLGATALPQVPQLFGDTASYGYLYQWGRGNDGHQQVRPYNTYAFDPIKPKGNQETGTPYLSLYGPAVTNYYDILDVNKNKFIKTENSGGVNEDWLKTPNNNLWQGLNGINNPCPSGFRVPTYTEFINETSNFSTQNVSGGFNSFLRLPVTGARNFYAGTFASYFAYNNSRYWTSSTMSGTSTYEQRSSIVLAVGASDLNFITTASQAIGTGYRAQGYAVRCIKGDATSGGNAVVSSYTTGTSNGTMTAGVPLTGVSQTISANVSTLGNYNIGAVANGVIFSAAGTFTRTGTQDIVLAASGTPLLGTTNTFSLNTIPNCSFDWTTAGASTNGTAVVSNYSVTNGTDIMFTGNPVTGITQNIDAFVTTPGAYNIKAVANGTTFAATGTFAGTGTQTITLVASGTPLLPGSFDFTINTTPGKTFNRTFYDQSSNGLAVISGYTLGTLVGTMTAGVPVSGVTQNITANVTTANTYTIATNTVNGVTFTANGTFASTGNQTIALTASGTPIVDETDAFTINTNPNLTFNLTTAVNPSTKGSAVVSAYTVGSSTGTMYTGVPVSGVSQTITANVTTVGTYNLSITVSGVTFAASGTFSNTGNQTITLNATGTPTTVSASATFNITTTPNISFSRIINSGTTNGLGIVSSYTSGTSIGTIYVGVPVSGVTQNITANVTTAGTYTITTNTINGVTFAGSGTFGGTGSQTITLTASGTPTAISALDNFTLNTTISGSFTRTTVDASTNGMAIVSGYTLGNSDGTMTAGVAVSGVTQTISANVTTPGTYTITTNTVNGVKFSANGTFAQTGAQDIVLTATGTPTSVSASDNFTINTNPNITFTKATIANPTTNGSAVVTYASSTSTGTMYVGVPVSGVTQTITATVTTIGTYSINTTANGVTFSGSGTFTGTGSKAIVLTASGTPTAVSASDNFITNTTPSFTFTRTTVVNLTSNGTAVVSAYTNGTSAGTLYRGVAVTGVTQTMIANVTTAGTYSITIPATNGVIFAASGTFTGTGNQTITLTASGTPTSKSTSTTFTLNTTPNGSFTRTTVEVSSNGQAIVTSYTISTSNGTMTAGTPVSGVTQNIIANVSTTGTYSITTNTVNGVTFAGSGTFGGTGNQTITLTASGTPTAAGTNGFTINTTPTLTFNR